MPTIPGVPSTTPVELPGMSPRIAGRGGDALADFGVQMEAMVSQQFAIEGHIRKAQEHVDALAARNELDAAYIQMQDDLAKTQNSRDVPEALQAGHDRLNDISKRWAESPAAMQIQMDADALRPSMGHIAQVRQVDLLGKEFKVTINRQGEQLAQTYATSRNAGDPAGEQAALSAFTEAIRGGVQTGLMGDIEAAEAVRLFRQGGQELQIKQAIANPDPNVNQQIFDQMNSDPKAFPDVTPGFLETAKTHAIDAKESHIKHQEWADGQMALNVLLRPLINQHINPGTGKFNADEALGDVAERFRKGDITIYQKEALDGGIKSFGADVESGLKKQAIKKQDDVIKLFHDRRYEEAYKAIEDDRPWFENSGYSELYKGLMNYGDTMQRQDRAEAKQDYALSRQQWKEDSYNTLVSVQNAIAAGHTFKDEELLQMAGHGEGKMLPTEINEAMKLSHSVQKDPDYSAAMDMLRSQLTGPAAPVKGSSPGVYELYSKERSRNNKRQIMTMERWQQLVEQHPNEDKMKLMADALQPAVQQQIGEKLDQLFGAQPKPPSKMELFKGIVSNFLNLGYVPKVEAPAAPTATKFTEGGKTWNIPASDVEEFKKEHPNARPAN